MKTVFFTLMMFSGIAAATQPSQVTPQSIESTATAIAGAAAGAVSGSLSSATGGDSKAISGSISEGGDAKAYGGESKSVSGSYSGGSESGSESSSQSDNAVSISQQYHNRYPDIPVNAGLAVADSCQYASTGTAVKVSVGGVVDDPVCTWIRLANTQMMARDNSASRCKADLDQRVAESRHQALLSASAKGVIQAKLIDQEVPQSCLDADSYQTSLNESLAKANDAASRTHSTGVWSKIGAQFVAGGGWLVAILFAL